MSRGGRWARRLPKVDVDVPCANLPAFRSWVLGLMEHAEVLSPPDVRADFVEWLERQVAG